MVNYILNFFFLFFFFSSTLLSQEVQKISLQLHWLHQFQFAGYYMAKEKGFYKKAGLSVKIEEYSNDIDVTSKVVNSHAYYGVGRSSILMDKANGKNVSLIFSAFQSTPSILLATKESGIKDIKDFKNKKMMVTQTEQNSASLFAMINHEKVNLNDIENVKHSFNIDDLINKKVDLMASYISNEPFLLDKKNIKYTIFDPKKHGFDFYSDILFTSKHEVKNHRDRVISFKEASIKGWEYAFSHIEESVDVILKKYNTQHKSKEALIYEANKLKSLAYYKTDKFGLIEKKKIQRIYDVYNIMGTINSKIDLNNLIFTEDKDSLNLTIAEKNWIKLNREISFSDISWEPFVIVKDKKVSGIIKDYFNLISKKTGLIFKYKPSKNWQNARDKFINNEIDILPGNKYIFEKENIGLLSDIYKTYPMVIITNKEYKYIESLESLNGKTIALPKNYTSYYYIKNKFPDINIIPANSIKQALMIVQNGRADAFIGHMAASLSIMSKLHLKNLNISGSTKFDFEHAFIVHKKNRLLLSIINKALTSITIEEKAKIDARWMSVTVKEKIDYTLLIELFGIGFIIVFVLLYKSRKLSEYNEKLMSSNKIILEKDKKLEKLNEQLKNSVSNALKDLSYAHKLAKIGTWKIDVQKGAITWDNSTYEMFARDKATNPIDSIENFRKIIHPQDLQKVDEAYNEHLKTTAPYFVNHRIILYDGSIKYVEERGETSYSEDGVPLISKGTVQDVTEQQLAILALRKKDEHLIQQSRLAQMGEMLSMIAHQWRQPLSAISATTNNLIFKNMLEEIDKNVLKEELILIDKYIQHLSKTIEDFRDFFKKDKQKNLISPKEIVQSTLDIVRISMENKSIQIKTNFICNKEVETYTSEIKHVVLNLMKNAEDALVENRIKNPCISIETNCSEDKVIFSIKDNGGGIPLDIKNNVFDPYFTTKEKKDGTGLGLYMSKIIIEDHCNGKLYFKSDKNGTVFFIELGKE